MKAAKIILGSLAATALFSSAALADQTMSGMVTKIDRINGTIAIKQTQDGTVGANAGGASPELKVQDSQLLEHVHAGDGVTLSVTDNGGVKTVTKIEEQKP